MHNNTRMDVLERKQKQLRGEMRRLRHWGKTTEDDCDWIEECYRYTCDEVSEAGYDFTGGLDANAAFLKAEAEPKYRE